MDRKVLKGMGTEMVVKKNHKKNTEIDMMEIQEANEIKDLVNALKIGIVVIIINMIEKEVKQIVLKIDKEVVNVLTNMVNDIKREREKVIKNMVNVMIMKKVKVNIRLMESDMMINKEEMVLKRNLKMVKKVFKMDQGGENLSEGMIKNKTSKEVKKKMNHLNNLFMPKISIKR